MGSLRDILIFIAIYAMVLLLVPKRWLPAEGSRAEWKVLVAVGLVTGLLLLRPELLAVVVLIWLGELVWHRLTAKRQGKPQ